MPVIASTYCGKYAVSFFFYWATLYTVYTYKLCISLVLFWSVAWNHHQPSLVPSDALTDTVTVASSPRAFRSNTSFDVISPVSGLIKNKVMLSTMPVGNLVVSNVE